MVDSHELGRERDRLTLRLTLALALAVWAWVAAPLLLQRKTLFLRDVFGIHLPLKAFGAEELRAGRVPAFNPGWGGGQAFRGNPQALAFYPGNVLYLLLPFWSAFNLHYVLHWLLAFLGLRALARTLGQSEGAALLGALAYAGGGLVLSALTFYNLSTVLAWWPWVLWGAARGGRRGVAWGGAACGLALLGGEPVSAALGLAPLGLVACERHGARRGAGTVLAIGSIGLLVALPQVVATARILPFTFRGGHGLGAEEAVGYGFHPLRLVELLVPLPFGSPGRSGALGYWATRIVPRPPFFYSLHLGVIAAALAVGAARARWRWLGLAALGVAAAWLGSAAGGVLAALSGGLFRYPEKFLLWSGWSVPLLAGWGFDALRERLRWRWGEWAALAAAAGAGLVFAARGVVLDGLAGPVRDLLDVQTRRWSWALLAAALLLGLGAWCVRRSRPAGLVALQLLAVLQLRAVVPRIALAPFRQDAAWLARLPGEPAVVSSLWVNSPWQPIAYRPGPPEELAQLLDPAPGVLAGISYPLGPDFEGMSTPLYALVLRNLTTMDWPRRVRWFQAVGADAAVLFAPVEHPALELLDERPQARGSARLYRVRGGAPRAWWPDRLIAAENPIVAVAVVNQLDDPVGTVAVARAGEQTSGATVRVVAWQPDRLVLDVAGEGGVVAVRRAYSPLWHASSGDARLATQPLNVHLLGVEVPAGTRRIELDVAAWPEGLAAAAALAVLAAALAVGWRG